MTPRKKISSLRKRPEASMAEAQGKFMKPAIIFAAFLSLILVSGIAPAAAPKYKTPKTTLSQKEVLRLTSKQRAIYFKRLARVIERIEKTNPGLSYRPKARKSYSWIEQLLGTAHAQSTDLRCIYGGEPIYGAECKPLTSKQITFIDSSGQAGNRTLRCGSGAALCGPFTYGLGATGNGLCLPPQVSPTAEKTFTERCRDAAFDSQETAVRTGEQIAWLLKSMPEAWSRHSQAIDQICSDDFINNNGRVNNRADLRNTCNVAVADVTKIRETQQEVVAQLANQNAEATQATSSPTQGPHAQRPRARSSVQTRPQARPPRIVLDDETVARAEGQELATAEDSRVAATASEEEHSQTQETSVDQAGLCQNIKLAEASRGVLSDAACESCRIEVSEKNATNNPNFKVSEKWMALMNAASKVCGKPLSGMVKEFGYCEEKADWQFDPNNTFFLKEIMKHSERMRQAYLANEVDRTFVGETHRVLRDMRSEYGFNTAFIAELFCEDKKQLKDNLNLMLQHEAALSSNPQQFQAYQSFKSCATEAIGMSETTGDDLNPVLEFNRERAVSRYDQMNCSEENLRTDAFDKDFMKAVSALRETQEPVLATKPGRSCQVLMSEGSSRDKLLVFDGATGQVSEVYNYKFFKDEEYSYQALSCDPSQYSSGDAQTDTLLRESVF